MNFKMLSGTLIASSLLLAACGQAEDATKDVGKKVEDTAKQAGDKAKETADKATSEPKAPNGEAEKALNKAKQYSDTMYMSKKGIYNQLTSQADQFKPEDAQWAVDNLKADYKKNALEKAKQYAETQNMSIDAVKQQLTSQFDAFTEEEAQYAVDNLK
ncbi:Ltp family lipoprotein [Macrococcus equipercicus]|uniref:Ltp family lipoprotein n=1 Tax=Macrococcus equipercicus TaxID=69967 RepID=A0A9Q9BV58_9STAP|nr:Ltp family lipoprotein [Macrococcus equipercicus]UTH14736.1 Ltp family lipoprotein [Macrococcus equipercicus]